jgi:hypothetical protein
MWWELLNAGQSEQAEQAFQIWLETLVQKPDSEQLATMSLTYVIQKTAQHDWDRLFPIGVTLQRTLIRMEQLVLAESLAQSLLGFAPPPETACQLHIGLGTTMFRRGRTEDALHYYTMARSEWHPPVGAPHLGRCYHGIGVAAMVLQQHEYGEAMTDQALRVYRDEDEELYYAALQNLAIVYAQTRRRTEAERAFLQCIEYWASKENPVAVASLREAIAFTGLENFRERGL